MPPAMRLFEPITVGNIELANRIVMLGMGLGFGDKYRVTDRLISFFRERAAGGVGLIIVSSLFPADFEDVNWAYPSAACSLGIWDDSFIAELRRLTDAVHKYGATIAPQLSLNYEWRASKRTRLEVVGPSAGIRSGRLPASRELTVEEINQVVGQFGEGTRRAREAGFDAVEFHFGNGFLINQFLSPRTNQRTDRYGGNLENRMRLPLEIIASARQKAGADFPLMCRFSGDEMMEGGLKLEDTLKMVPLLERAGISAIDAQVGTEQTRTSLIQQWVPPGAFVYVARAFKNAVKIPVVAAHRIKDPTLAEAIISEGRADLVGMARALLADPEWPNKVKAGKSEDIRHCISCCRCLDDVMEAKPVRCTVNGRAGKEIDYPSYQPAAVTKKIVVVGGGPAGMEAAGTAALRGHDVSLYEKAHRLGGSMLLASVVNDEIRPYMKYLQSSTAKLPIRVLTGQEYTPQIAAEAKPDVVILATGGHAPILHASEPTGANTYHVNHILEIIQGGAVSPNLRSQLPWYSASGRDKIAIIGGGPIACQLAYFLAAKGKKVTIIGESERVGQGIGPTTRWGWRNRLREAGVSIIDDAMVDAITDHEIRISQTNSSQTIGSDIVIVDRPLKSTRELESMWRDIIPEVHAIGDCAEPGQIREAVSSAIETAMRL